MTDRARRLRSIGLLCAIGTAGWLLLFAAPPDRFPFTALARAELWAKDLFLTKTVRGVPDPRLVFVGIDPEGLVDILGEDEIAQSPTLAQMTNTFPWSRAVWAAVVERLAEAGAKVIVLDLVFATPGAGDDPLRAALDKHAERVVIGANFSSGERGYGEAQSVVYPTESVLNVQDVRAAWNDPRVGFVNFFTYTNAHRREIDDVVRRAIFRVTGERGLPPGATLESLATRALKKFGAANAVPSDTRPHLFRYASPPGGFPVLPLYSLFLPSHWSNNFGSGTFFRDKIVMVGPAANILHDEHRTPFNVSMLGPEIHLNVMSAALRGDFLREPPEPAKFFLIAAFGLLSFLLAAVIRGPVRRLFVSVGVVAAYAFACHMAMAQANVVLLAVTPMIAFSTGAFATFVYDFVLLRIEKNRTRRTLERYVSKDVVQEVLDNPQTFLNALGGVRKPVTILFSDVRGFTTMAEQAEGGQFVGQLNEYFNEMVAIVFRERGSLDKFIGDAVMALWGSMTSHGRERDAQHAVAAALAMRPALARLNISWRQRGMKEFSFGIGINHGEVIVGNLGSEQKMEVSVIGDPVNLASRLEGLTKEYKLDLLLGESLVPLVQSRFALRTVDSVQVKGKTKPVHVFTVMADLEAGEQAPPWLARYEQGVVLYRGRKFAEAGAAFGECLRAAPDDYLCQLYAKRCEELIANPPGPDWDTVFVMKSK